jgi:reactive intermediate/imine deaminase
MTGKQIVDPGWAYHKAFQYSQAVRAGDLLLLAGQCPVDAQGSTVAEGDIRGQTRQVFENLKAVLAAAGLTLDDLVEIVSYHTDLADLPAVAEVKAEYLTRDFPAWTAVGVTALAFPGQLLEIKATALARRA